MIEGFCGHCSNLMFWCFSEKWETENVIVRRVKALINDGSWGKANFRTQMIYGFDRQQEIGIGQHLCILDILPNKKGG